MTYQVPPPSEAQLPGPWGEKACFAALLGGLKDKWDGKLLIKGAPRSPLPAPQAGSALGWGIEPEAPPSPYHVLPS